MKGTKALKFHNTYTPSIKVCTCYLGGLFLAMFIFREKYHHVTRTPYIASTSD